MIMKKKDPTFTNESQSEVIFEPLKHDDDQEEVLKVKFQVQRTNIRTNL